MRSLRVAVMLGFAGAAAANFPVAARPTPTGDAEAKYQALLAAAKAGAPNADWGALRLAYAGRPSFNVFAQSDAKRRMLAAAQKGDCAAALPAARAAIDESYVDIDAHLVAAFCEDKAGDHAAARLDRDIGAGLAASIKTGDGLSPATAFTPIDVAEEYALMRTLGLHVAGQALIQKDGHAYDALTGVDQAGHQATYYFLIDRVMAAEAATLQPGSASRGGPRDRAR